MNRRVAFPALLASCILLTPHLNAQTRSGSVVDTRPRGSYTIRGNLRLAQNEKPVETVKVELRRFAGDVVGTIFTRSNGEFEFPGLSAGTYYLIVEEPGYEPVRDSIEVISSSLFGVAVYLKKIGTPPGEAGHAVSVRELSLPNQVRTAFRKGMDVLYEKNDPAASLAILRQVISAAPAFYEAHFHMGIAYNQLNQPMEAEAAFRKSIAASEEKYPQALIALASLLTSQQNAAEAEPLARRALTLDATLWQGHYEMGRALAALTRPEEAEKSLAELIRLNKDYPPAYLLLANIHMRTKNYSALLGDLNEFLRLEPSGPQSAQAKKMRDSIQQAMDNAKNAPAAPPKP